MVTNDRDDPSKLKKDWARNLNLACVRSGTGKLSSSQSRAKKVALFPRLRFRTIDAYDSPRGWCNDLENQDIMIVETIFACRNKGGASTEASPKGLVPGRIEFQEQPNSIEPVYIDGFCTHSGSTVIPVRLKGPRQELLCNDDKGNLWYGEIEYKNRWGSQVYKSPTAVKIASNWCKSGNILAGDINGDRNVDIVCKDTNGDFKILAGAGNYRYTPMDIWAPDKQFCGKKYQGWQLADVNGDGIQDFVCIDNMPGLVKIGDPGYGKPFRTRTFLNRKRPFAQLKRIVNKV